MTIAGSTTVQKRILEPLSPLIEKELGIKLTIVGNSTGNGFDNLVAGTVAASIASAPLGLVLEKKKLPADGTYEENVIMQDTIAIIVHPSNPVAKLSWEQIADINTGKAKNWKEVGGEDAPIMVITSSKGAATRTFLQEEVMKKAEYVTGVREVTTTRGEIDMVAKLKSSIGAVSEGFIALNLGKVKAVDSDKKITRPLSIKPFL